MYLRTAVETCTCTLRLEACVGEKAQWPEVFAAKPATKCAVDTQLPRGPLTSMGTAMHVLTHCHVHKVDKQVKNLKTYRLEYCVVAH